MNYVVSLKINEKCILIIFNPNYALEILFQEAREGFKVKR